MSSKSSKGPSKTKTPRQIADIQAEYQQLCLQAGQMQYQAKVLNDQLAEINKTLLAVNNEGAERNKIDAAAKAQTEAEVK